MRQFKIILGSVALLVLLSLGIYLGFTVARLVKPGGEIRITGTASVIKQVQTLSDLVTVRYVMEKVVILQDVKWYGENRVFLLAHGVVKAGINLQKLRPEDVTVADKKISIKLPPAEITDAYLDDGQSRVIDHTTGLLRAFDKDIEQTARQNAVDDIRRAARQAGILTDAEERARLELELFLRQAGFQTVEFQ